MSVRVEITVGDVQILVDRGFVAHVSVGDDRNEVIRQALPVLDGIREDLARMVAQPGPAAP